MGCSPEASLLERPPSSKQIYIFNINTWGERTLDKPGGLLRPIPGLAAATTTIVVVGVVAVIIVVVLLFDIAIAISSNDDQSCSWNYLRKLHRK